MTSSSRCCARPCIIPAGPARITETRPRCITRSIPDAKRRGQDRLPPLMPEGAALVGLHGMLATFAEQLAGVQGRRLGHGRFRRLGRVLVAAGGFLIGHSRILVEKIPGKCSTEA